MASRFFRYGELHLVLLALLSERPMHGYELMGELNARFGPRYRASAGGVYPAIQSLTGEGLIEEQHDSEPVRYRPTAAGDTAIAKRADTLARIQERTGVHFGARPSVEVALAHTAAAARAAAERGAQNEVEIVLDRAVRALEALIPHKETP